jgi:uncharacterized protein (DUF362 family)
MPSKVFVRETSDRKDFVNSVLKRFQRDFKDRTIFVKPNIVSYEPYPTTTHAAVLDTVLKFLTDKGNSVVVGDGPATDSGNHSKIMENSPLNRVCGKYFVELVDLHEYGFRKFLTRSGYRLRVSEIPYECDYMISLPVLKAHSKTTITGATKNLFGLLQNRERMMMYARLKNMHRCIAELHSAFKANLTIMDAVETLITSSEVRHGGEKKKLGYMLAGDDPLAIDSLGLHLLQGVDPNLKGKKLLEIKHLEWMKKLNLGKIDYKRARI